MIVNRLNEVFVQETSGSAAQLIRKYIFAPFITHYNWYRKKKSIFSGNGNGNEIG